MKVQIDEQKERRKAKREVMKDRDFTTKVHSPQPKAKRHSRKPISISDLDDLNDLDDEFYE